MCRIVWRLLTRLRWRARETCGDGKSYPCKGQVLIVRMGWAGGWHVERAGRNGTSGKGRVNPQWHCVYPGYVVRKY